MAVCGDGAALYVGRLACAGAAWGVGFAPTGRLARWFLSSLSPALLLRLPRPLAWAARRLLLPHVSVAELTDGNVNFSFSLRARGAVRGLFVKHATGFVKWQPQMLLDAARMRREVCYYTDAAAVLGEAEAARFQPALHMFDEAHMVMVMDFLEGHELLIERCFDPAAGVPTAAAAAAGSYLGQVHGRTMDKEGREVETAQRAVRYWNHELRAVQLEHVFNVCYEHSARGRALASSDPTFMAEVLSLKARYLGYSLGSESQRALCHGDCHAGSVMVAADGRSVKVIDPEFAVFGPPGLDIGSLMFAFVCGFIFHVQTSRRSDGTGTAGNLRSAISTAWQEYSAQLATTGASKAELRQVAEDAVGFCMCEVVRTSLGFAGARNPALRLGSADEVDRYEELAVQVAQRCMTGRRTAKPLGDAEAPIKLLLQELDRIQADEKQARQLRVPEGGKKTI